ncbi:hypothetical protein BJY24_006975 [Nocardia transvalensis]|uniref:Uncharacterized protein n=1 Tax=Nocardia transvalensis TaxID=37333 RepID=A0A7W9ULZ4_9NOCA|nr:hypothetical protein [Nocardia transvalensis]MBB5918063.1 hypothetical protein [Nocardia transvalensis]
MVCTTICATGPASSEAAETLSGLDARLLALDPDLAELFAEVDEILCQARDRWISAPARGHRPRPHRPWRRRPALRHGRRPGPVQARGRGPPVLGTPARLDALDDKWE